MCKGETKTLEGIFHGAYWISCWGLGCGVYSHVCFFTFTPEISASQASSQPAGLMMGAGICKNHCLVKVA